jgi:hypothetical protein
MKATDVVNEHIQSGYEAQQPQDPYAQQPQDPYAQQ